MDLVGIARAFFKGHVPDAVLERLEVPRDSSVGDAALPCFLLAAQYKKPPQEVARDLAAALKPSGAISSVEAAGPYVNLRIDKAYLAKEALAALKAPKMGIPKAKPACYLFEYPSPNTNKPLHLGHVRNMLLGQACARLNAALGHRVFSVNLNNDRGVHICKSMLAYQRWGKNRPPDTKSDHYVGKFYVLYNQKVKGQPALEEEIKEMLRKWEARDAKVRALWKRMNMWALKGFNETYKTFGIRFDKTYNESAFYHLGKAEVAEGVEKGLFVRQADGAVLAPLTEFGLPDKVLQRADGTAVYITQDIVLAKLKRADFGPAHSVYVVGSEQNLHFQQLFRILELQGFPAGMCHHLSYGMISLPSGRMKSREGQTADADDVVGEVVGLARKELKKRYKLPAKELERRANVIAMAAIRFFILKYDPQKDFVFDPEESLSFEGETGPYVQYTYARIRSIFRKGRLSAPPRTAGLRALTEPLEQQLITQLAGFGAAVGEAAAKYRPSALAHYLLKLAQAYNEYYHKVPVLQSGPRERAARLVLSDAVARVLKRGLELLGIETLEVM